MTSLRARLPGIVSLFLALSACNGKSPSAPIPDCAQPCACCAEDEVCADGECCRPSCAGRRCGSDGCGGSCGSCGPTERCDEPAGLCACLGESEAALCDAADVVCGPLNTTDRCGHERVLACDRCDPSTVCNQASGACECRAETDAQLCAYAGKECGPFATTDTCGESRAIDCGACAAGLRCGADNACEPCDSESDADFCARLGKTCGAVSAPDLCGLPRTVECGECAEGSACEADNTCRPCASPEPDLDFCARAGLQCGAAQGTDRCGWSRTFECGACPAPQVCGDANRCMPCTSESDATLCSRYGKSCGPLEGADNCGAPRAVADCGACAPAEICSSGNCALCIPESDVDLCAFYFRNCGTPALVDHCGVSRTPGCGSCSGSEDCLSGSVCGYAGQPSNDNCANPERLVFDPLTRSATAHGDTTGANDSVGGSCGGWGPDVLYAFTLATNQVVTATVTPGNPQSQPVLYLVTTCTGIGDLGCATAPTPGQDTTLTVPLAAGTYLLVVDTYSGAPSGAFTLTVRSDDVPPVPSNDTCANPTALTFTNDTASVTGTTIGATNDATDLCEYMFLDGPEVVYSFTLSAPSAVLVRVVRDAAAVSFQPVARLLSTCTGDASGNSIGCGPTSNGVSVVSNTSLAAGTWYVIVEGVGGSSGGYTLEVTLATPVLNDLCAGATDIPLTAVAGTGELTGSIAGNTSIGTDDYVASCNSGSTGRDLVYSFTLSGPDKNVRVQVTPDAGSGIEPVLSVRDDCSATDDLGRCGYAYITECPVWVAIHRLSAGTYYVFVDGYMPGTNGSFTLTVSAVDTPPPPPNDICGRPEVLPIDPATGIGRVTGSTLEALDDYGGSCATIYDPHTGGDVVYSVTLPSRMNLSASVASGSPDYRAAVYVQSTCGAAATDKSCGAQDYTGVATASASELPAGTYYVVVDGVAGSSGDYTLEVLAYVPLTNEDCSTATPIVFDASDHFLAHGDSCALRGDTTSWNSGGCSGNGVGKDNVYKFELTQPKNVTVDLAPGHGGTTYLYLRSDCARPSSELACGTGFGINHLLVKNLAAGTYYLWLDSDWSCGVYALDVQLSSPPTPQSNDTCAAPEQIALDSTTGAGSATGNTDAASPDDDGSCRAGSGPELVYSFALATPSSVVVNLTPQAGSALKPVLYLRSACATGELACKAYGWEGANATVQFPRLAAGTWYVFVDAWDRNGSGPFDLAVATTPVGPLATNDACASATAMPAFDTVTNKTSLSGNTVDGTNGDASTCSRGFSAHDGPDLYYRFTLANAARVRATVTATGASPTFRPAVSIRGSCALEDELACAGESGGSSSIADLSLPPGTYDVVVDGVDGSFGAFTLELENLGASVPGDNCGVAIPLSFTASTAIISGDLATAGNQMDEGCMQNTGGKDLVYSFALASEAGVSVTLSATSSPTLQPVVALRAACSDMWHEVGCAFNPMPGSSASVSSARLRPGTYFVVVDALRPNGGLFTLTVQTTAPTVALQPNDGCASALAVALDPTSGAARLAGDTRGAYDDSRGSCDSPNEPQSGGDLVYKVTQPAAATLVAAVTRDPSTPGYLPAVYIRAGSCASGALVDERGCATTSQQTAAVTAANLAAGTYYVVVDGQKGTGGAFTLDLATGSAPVSNDSCATARLLQLDSTGLAEVVGDTNDGVVQTAGSGSCYSSGPELYYTLTTNGIRDITAEVVPGSGSYQPAVYIRANCTDPTSLRACDYNYGNAPAQASALRLPGGSYTIVVDSEFPAGAGPFILRVSAVDPPPPPLSDTCRSPDPITVPDPVAPTVLIDGSTLAANDNYSSVCATNTDLLDGPDVVYALTVTTNAKVTARVTPKAASLRYRPALYVRRACDSVSGDLCNVPAWGAGPTVSAWFSASLAAGTYYLIVDGVSGTAGDYSLQISWDTSLYVAADHCINATSIDSTFVSGTLPTERVATIAGDTTNASNDGDGNCNGGSGRDLVYSFSVAAESFVTVDLSADSGSGFLPSLYVRSTCTNPVSEVFCRYSWSSPLTGSLYHLPPGTYYLVVDGVSSWGGHEGPFTAHVSVRDMPAAPANDTCSGATVLSFVSGTGTQATATVPNQQSAFANDDLSGSCAPTRGNDLVYRFTLTTARSFSATVTPDATATEFEPALYLRTACGSGPSAAEVTCRRASGTAYPITVTANSLPPGTYYLVVDTSVPSSVQAPGGAFSLEATIDDPLPGPANDGCAFAQPIALSGPAPSVTTVTGQTTLHATDHAVACGANSDGPDVVYRLDLAAAAHVKVKVTPSAGFLPAVYLRSTCADSGAAALACGSNAITSTPVEATRAYLQAGTYFVWVDAASSSSSGPFELEVTLSVPTAIPPANDICGPSIPVLAKGVSVQGTTYDAFNDYAGIGNAACGSYNVPGPDVVYAYTPRVDGPITVALTSNAADLMPWMSEGACGDTGACVAASDSAGPNGGTDVATYFNGRAGVTYFIHVDSYMSTNMGTFTLVVQ